MPYVGNDPTNHVDPYGLISADPGDGSCWEDDDGNIVCDDEDGDPVGPGGLEGTCPAGEYYVEASNDCETGDSNDDDADPEQCDITLMGASAVIPGDPFGHSWLQMTVLNTNTGDFTSKVLEANAVSKNNTNVPATKQQLLTGQAYLNGGFSATPLKGSGEEIYNFDNNDQLCAFIKLLGVASSSYRNNVVAYKTSGPNSNTFTAYMLAKAGMQLPATTAFHTVFRRAGILQSDATEPVETKKRQLCLLHD